MKRTITLAAAGALLLTGCGDSEPSPTEVMLDAGATQEQVWACNDAITGYNTFSPEDRTARADYARDVNEWAQLAGGEIKTAGDDLARSAAGPTALWNYAVDSFAAKCIDLGWPTK